MGATLISIDLSLSILSIKLLICNRNGETNFAVIIQHYPLSCRPTRQTVFVSPDAHTEISRSSILLHLRVAAS